MAGLGAIDSDAFLAPSTVFPMSLAVALVRRLAVPRRQRSTLPNRGDGTEGGREPDLDSDPVFVCA